MRHVLLVALLIPIAGCGAPSSPSATSARDMPAPGEPWEDPVELQRIATSVDALLEATAEGCGSRVESNVTAAYLIYELGSMIVPCSLRVGDQFAEEMARRSASERRASAADLARTYMHAANATRRSVTAGLHQADSPAQLSLAIAGAYGYYSSRIIGDKAWDAVNQTLGEDKVHKHTWSNFRATVEWLRFYQAMTEAHRRSGPACQPPSSYQPGQVLAHLESVVELAKGTVSEGDTSHDGSFGMLGGLDRRMRRTVTDAEANGWWPVLLTVDMEISIFEAYWRHYHDEPLPPEEVKYALAELDSRGTSAPLNHATRRIRETVFYGNQADDRNDQEASRMAYGLATLQDRMREIVCPLHPGD